MRKIYHAIFHYTSHIFAWFCSIFCILCVILFTKLYFQSINLSSIQPQLEEYLSKKLPHMHLKFSKCNLKWQPDDGGLVLDLGKTSATHINEKKPLFTAKQLVLDFHLIQMFLHTKDTFKLVLVEPDLHYTIANDYAQHIQSTPKAFPGIEIRNGNFDITYGANRWTAKEVNCSIYRKKDLIYINSTIPLSIGPITINAQIPLQGNTITGLHCKALAKDCDLKDLAQVWPEWIAFAPREWITTHILAGAVPKAKMAATIVIQKDKYSLEKLCGTIHISNACLDYLPGMPKVEKINACAKFDANAFDITVNSATSYDMNVLKGNVKINGLSEPDQSIDIDLTIDSDVQKALKFLQLPSLGLRKITQIPLHDTMGHAVTDLQLSLPLSSSLQLQNLKISAQSKINKLSSKSLIQVLGKKIPFEAEHASLSFENDILKIDSRIKALHIIATVSLTHAFDQEHTVINLNANGNERILNHFDLPQFIHGDAPADVIVSLKKGDLDGIKGHMILTNTSITLPVLGNIKPMKQKCDINADLTFKSGALYTVKHLQLKGDHISASATYDRAHNLLSCKQAEWKGSKADIDISTGKVLGIAIKGEKITIHPTHNQKTSFKIEPTNLDLRVRLQQLILPTHGALEKFNLYFQQRGKQVRKLFADAQFNKTNLFSIRTSADNEIILKSLDIGAFSNLWNFSSNLEKGELLASATMDSNGQIKGTFLIERCYLKQQSFWASLIGHASPLGIVDALRGKSIALDTIRSDFTFADDKLRLMQGSSSGHTVGFTFNGVVSNQYIDLYGTVMPLNFFNQTIAAVPLIGGIFKEGFFGISYHVVGDIDNPKVKFNPLSTFAPGIFKEIFSYGNKKPSTPID